MLAGLALILIGVGMLVVLAVIGDPTFVFIVAPIILLILSGVIDHWQSIVRTLRRGPIARPTDDNEVEFQPAYEREVQATHARTPKGATPRR